MQEPNKVTCACPHCGRTWVAVTKAPGPYSRFFFSSNVATHRKKCVHQTPQERKRQALRDERRWKLQPLKNTLCTINWSHQGMLTDEQRQEPTE